MVSQDGTVLRQQEGVFRSNCMDCLDRTNVVQGLFAKVTLEEQLHVSAMPPNPFIHTFSYALQDFILTWHKYLAYQEHVASKRPCPPSVCTSLKTRSLGCL